MDVTIVLWFETMCWWSSQKISVLSIIAWSQTRLGLGRGQIRRVLSPGISYQSTIYPAMCFGEYQRREVVRITNECGHVTHNQDIWHVSRVMSGNQNDPQNYRTLNQRNQWDIYCRDCIIFTLTWLKKNFHVETKMATALCLQLVYPTFIKCRYWIVLSRIKKDQSNQAI